MKDSANHAISSFFLKLLTELELIDNYSFPAICNLSLLTDLV